MLYFLSDTPLPVNASEHITTQANDLPYAVNIHMHREKENPQKNYAYRLMSRKEQALILSPVCLLNDAPDVSLPHVRKMDKTIMRLCYRPIRT